MVGGLRARRARLQCARNGRLLLLLLVVVMLLLVVKAVVVVVVVPRLFAIAGATQ